MKKTSKPQPTHNRRTIGPAHDAAIRRVYDNPKAAPGFPKSYPGAPGSLKGTDQKKVPFKGSTVPVDSSSGSGSVPID